MGIAWLHLLFHAIITPFITQICYGTPKPMDPNISVITGEHCITIINMFGYIDYIYHCNHIDFSCYKGYGGFHLRTTLHFMDNMFQLLGMALFTGIHKQQSYILSCTNHRINTYIFSNSFNVDTYSPVKILSGEN